MIDLSVRRPVATAAIYVALLALGAYSFQLIPLELLPDVDYPRLTVTATWNGASPESMEATVTAPLESAVQQVPGVRNVTSRSRATPRGSGASTEIDVEFSREARMQFARLELTERIAALEEELPPGVDPVVSPYVPDEFSEEQRDFLTWQIHGPFTPGRLTQAARDILVTVIEGVEGVADVRVVGSEPRELAVELDPQRLASLGVHPNEVRSKLQEISAPRPVGAVPLDGRVTALTVRTRAEDVAELRDLVVSSGRSGVVRLADVARIRDQAAEPRGYHRIDGRPVVTLQVFRSSGTNAVDVADRAKAAMDSARTELPSGVRAELDQDRSEDIKAQLSDLRLRALAAAVVIFLVLTLFLRSLGSVLVVFATIGFSVLIAVNLLYLGGFSLNVLTLAGLAWGFGLVVDNGIVVLENVERHRALGSPPEKAASEGARQVLLPVVAATATTGIVLVPFLFFQGELRVYYVPLAFAVGFSILASLFVAFTFVPALTARLPGRGEDDVEAGGPDGVASSADEGGEVPSGDEGPAGPSEAGTRFGTGTVGGSSEPVYVRGYRALLGAALDHPFVVALVCLGALAGSWHLFDDYVRRGVRFGSYGSQQTYIEVRITFPRGAGLQRTDDLARAFEGKLSQLPEVERYETTVQPTWALIRVTFPPELERTQVPVAIKEQMVAYSYGFSGPDVRVYGYGPSFYGGGSSPPNYDVDVLGYSYLKVQEIAEGLARRLERFSRIRQVDPNASGRFTREKAFEYFVQVDREALGAYDVSVEQLLAYVSSNVEGRVFDDRIRVGGEEVPVAVKLAGYRSFDFQDLRELRVPAGNGGSVRLADVATIQQRDVLADIVRENQQYRRTVAWEFRGPRKLGDLVRDVAVEATDLPPGYRIDVEDRYRWSDEERTQVYVALAFGVLLVYMVTAALFESLAAPFVVLLTLPLALIGVFLIFFYADATFTRTGYIGTIMMGGIVVNNAILIVYHIGELREMLPTRDAIVRGTLERVRPILMTTLTTIFGLLPLVLFAESQDANIWNALALATIGGLISSTMFVLVAIPVAYRWIVARGEV